jgi:hypothetical protein
VRRVIDFVLTVVLCLRRAPRGDKRTGGMTLSRTHQQSLAYHESLACPVPVVAITTNDPNRGRKAWPTPSCPNWCRNRRHRQARLSHNHRRR